MSSENNGPGVNFYCDFLINGHRMVTANIVDLVIREWITDNVPRLDFIISDDGILSEIYPLQEGDTISIKLGKHLEDKNVLNSDFELYDYTYGSALSNKFIQVKSTAVLKLDNFYMPKLNRSFKNKNSIDILKIIAGECNKEISIPRNFKTNDLMTWYQINQTNHDFMNHIKKRSNKSNDLLLSYFDAGGNMVIDSIDSAISKNKIKEARYSIENYSEDIFNNDADLNTLWFNSWSVTSHGGYLNKTKSYGLQYGYYDKNDGFIEKEKSNDDHKLTELSSKNKKYIGTNSDTFRFGFLNNVYKDYFKAISNNDYLISEFLSGTILELNVNALSPVKLLDVVNAFIPSTLNNEYNQVISGKYVVIGIVRQASKGDVLKKKVILCRNGRNKSPIE